MAKIKRGYVLATCFLSGAAAILTFVSLGTEEWVVAGSKVVTEESNEEPDNVHIGLFSGQYNQNIGSTTHTTLSLTCLFDLNICSMLCDGGDPYSDLRKMYKGEPAYTPCASPTRRIAPRASHDETRKYFINAGILICTSIFLIISGVLGVLSCALAVWNTAASPYQVYFSIFAMYIYNGVASACALLAVILYGSLFATTLTHNVPTYQTYNEFSTDTLAQLGWSYWLNLVSVFLYIGSFALLYTREYLISKEPKIPDIHLEDNSDPVIYLY